MDPFWLTIVAVIISVAFFVIRYDRLQKALACFPGPAHFFGLGALLTYGRFLYLGIPEASSYYLKRYGDVVRVWICGEPTLITSNPKVAHHILKHNGNNYTSRLGYDAGLNHIGMFHNGIIWNNHTALWKCLRSFFQNALNAKTLNAAIKASAAATNKIVSQLDQLRRRTTDGKIETLNVLRRITLQVTNLLMLGVDIEDDEHLVALIVEYFKAWEYFLIRPWYLYFPTTTYSKHKEAVFKLKEACMEIVQQKKKQLLKVPFEEIENPNFLECLLHAVQLKNITEDNVCQCVLEMFIAGTDTSSVSMYYTLVALSDDRKVEEQIVNELKNISMEDESTDRKLLSQLIYLENALKESMRIKPVGPVILRRALKDDVINGIPVVSGTNIVLSLVDMHRRNDLFENPSCFVPDRFKDEKTSEDFLPFGTGPKRCVGQFFAMVEMKVILGILLKKFKFRSDVGCLNDVTTRWDIANQPTNPSYMTIEDRRKCE